MCTALFPTHFLVLGAGANAIKGLAWMAGGSTRSAFNVAFSRHGNIADITAKATSQTICTSLLGNFAGVALASYIGYAVSTVIDISEYRGIEQLPRQPMAASIIKGPCAAGADICLLQIIAIANKMPLNCLKPLLLTNRRCPLHAHSQDAQMGFAAFATISIVHLFASYMSVKYVPLSNLNPARLELLADR